LEALQKDEKTQKEGRKEEEKEAREGSGIPVYSDG
jgi:hypothetical protein